MPASTASTKLYSLLDSLANGSASCAIEDAHEANYPVSFDPTTGLLIVSEDN